eukprot:TRINITY_DN2907_c0_g1_i2.p1 TRINITY_DN2907_c0_g1~~TRINITY_DN2907_c0_g1_i2.p1  ORF type:complete len:111 (-),score=7.20 TRINITY_DN2907_c0_g1_i2:508-840(-)
MTKLLVLQQFRCKTLAPVHSAHRWELQQLSRTWLIPTMSCVHTQSQQNGNQVSAFDFQGLALSTLTGARGMRVSIFLLGIAPMYENKRPQLSAGPLHSSPMSATCFRSCR